VLRLTAVALAAAAVASGLSSCGASTPPPRLLHSPGPTNSRAFGLGTSDLGEEGDQTSEPSPVAPGTGLAWAPVEPLPTAAAPQQSDRPVDIVLSPHPDDETLSLGVWIANRVQRGDRVIVVALTDGRATGAATAIARRLGRVVDRDQIAVARMREMRSAAAALGVSPTDVYPAHLDTDTSPGGSRATVPEVAAVVSAFAERFPQAEFSTMSYLAEHHKDHLNAGHALLDAWQSGQVSRVEFAVSRLYWNQPLPGEHDELPVSAEARARVIAAARAYELWDPSHGRLSVGWFSVRPQFEALVADPVDRLHEARPTFAPTTADAGPQPSG
jgi:LmbE family N-acetylglucosaminyl deacetylase